MADSCMLLIVGVLARVLGNDPQRISTKPARASYACLKPLLDVFMMWKSCNELTQVENSLRKIKRDLGMRLIFQQNKRRNVSAHPRMLFLSCHVADAFILDVLRRLRKCAEKNIRRIALSEV